MPSQFDPMRALRPLARAALLLGMAAGLDAQITGGMVSPAMDLPGQPFSYFSHPTDVIGIMNAPVASEVTPEGYIYTGFGELMFYTGNPPQAVDRRIKTLYREHLPAVEYSFEKDGVVFEFRMFAADAGGPLQGMPVNFVRVRLRNPGKQPRTGFVGAGFRFNAHTNTLVYPQYRFTQKFQNLPTRYTEGQTKFNADWQYSFASDGVLRDGRLLYLFPPAPWQRSLALAEKGYARYRYFTGEIEGNANPRFHTDPQKEMGVVMYRVPLAAGATQTLVFRMPLAPLPNDSPEAAQLRKADCDALFQKTMAEWSGRIHDDRPELEFPEAKVQQALLANTVFNLLALDRVGGDYILNVNKFQYHRFYSTDSALMMAALDDMGQADIVDKAARYNVKTQARDGDFGAVVKPQFYEAFGHVLWAWQRHYALTRDEQFLRDTYPALLRAVEWEQRLTAADPLGLLPPSTVWDDARLKDAHQSGMNIWALAGLKCAVRLAQAAGKADDAARFGEDYQRLRAAFDKQLARQTALSGGYIPPSLDRTLKGNDWDNLHTLYPEPLFDPGDPRVDATIRTSRKTYREGIIPHVLPFQIGEKDGEPVFQTKPGLIYWRTPDNSENQLVRGAEGDQKQVVEDLYAMLVHTTSTHATQEYGTEPWGTRDFGLGNLLPDGSTSGVLIELMRNMLVREYGDELHLFSALSPEWLRPGRTVAARNEPTAFGPVTAVLASSADHLDIQLPTQFRQAPRLIVVHVPWFYQAARIEIDGKPAAARNGSIEVSPGAARVRIAGRIRPDTQPMSYRRAVEAYQREYRRRYDLFLATGEKEE